MEVVDKRKFGLSLELEGKKFGTLLVVQKTEFRQNNSVCWLCLCDCGTTILVNTHSLKYRKSCGCLNKFGKKEKGQSCFNRLVRQYKRDAKKRNQEFSLTEKQCFFLFKQDCFYCAKAPGMEITDFNANGSFFYNGIDRVDNEKHYISNNVVSCCYECNERKHTLEYATFYGKIFTLHARIEHLSMSAISYPLVGLDLKEITDIKVGDINRFGRKGKSLPGVPARNKLYHRYMENAKKRNVEFKLSKEAAVFLFERDCYYCGEAPKGLIFTKNCKEGYTYNGIDRVDNSKDYVENNCVSCCKICNFWKSNWTFQQFKRWVFNIVRNHNFLGEIKRNPDLKDMALDDPFKPLTLDSI